MIVFGMMLLIIFSLLFGLSTVFNIKTLSFEDKASLAKNLSRWVDRQISEMISSSSRLAKALQSWEALLDYEDDITKITDTLIQNKNIKENIPDRYQWLYDLGAKWIAHKDELVELLWSDRPRRYLIALMNTNEIRPNGGFFGSYAIVEFYRGKLTKYQVYDSYYAYHANTGVKLQLEPLYANLLGQDSINFISPNVYWWTREDAGNIKLLYERLFPGQIIDGVIMLKSDLFEFLLPEIRNKLIERQFVNASIDLIRGKVEGNKKEKYLSDIGSYLEQHKSTIINQLIINLPSLLQQQFIQVYVPNSSTSFQKFLATEWLEQMYKPEYIQVQHINKSYNKIDNFVTKRLSLQQIDSSIIQETTDSEIDTHELELKSGKLYDLYFFYTLNIPQSYFDQIYGLTKQFSIDLTQREKHILGMSYNRHNQIMLHLPEDMVVERVDGDIFCKSASKNDCYKIWDGKHHQIVTFDMLWFVNNGLKVVRVRMRKI